MADKEQVDPSEYTPGKVTISRQEYDELTQTKTFIDSRENITQKSDFLSFLILNTTLTLDQLVCCHLYVVIRT